MGGPARRFIEPKLLTGSPRKELSLLPWYVQGSE